MPRGSRIHYAWVVLAVLVVAMIAASGLRAVFAVFIRRHRLIVVPCGVEYHLDNALDVPVGRFERTDIHAEPASDR